MITTKAKYMISALRTDSKQLGHLTMHDTQAKAVEIAKSIIEIRERTGQAYIDFFVIKIVAHVGKKPTPVKVTSFK